jgi:hypothetical protein
MSEPVAETPHCDHFAQHGYGVVWPIEVSLEHFDDCLPAEERLRRYHQWRDMVNRAIICDEQHGHLYRDCTCGIPQYGPGQEHHPECPRWVRESRPADDPADEIVCNGRNCGGHPHG